MRQTLAVASWFPCFLSARATLTAQDQPQSLGDIARQQREARQKKAQSSCEAPCIAAYAIPDLSNSPVMALGPKARWLAIGSYGGNAVSLRDAKTRMPGFEDFPQPI